MESHLAFPEHSRVIGVCPRCTDKLLSHEQYAFDDVFGAYVHIECMLERRVPEEQSQVLLVLP